MTAFEIILDCENVLFHSAMIKDGCPTVSFHFSENGTMRLRFPSVAAVKEFIFNLECAFVDDRFVVEPE